MLFHNLRKLKILVKTQSNLKTTETNNSNWILIALKSKIYNNKILKIYNYEYKLSLPTFSLNYTLNDINNKNKNYISWMAYI